MPKVDRLGITTGSDHAVVVADLAVT